MISYKAKKIVVYPGKCLSLKRHSKRDEYWYIIHGKARMTLDNRINQFTLNEGQSAGVPGGPLYRIEDIGTDGLLFIEVQAGNYIWRRRY